MLGERVCALFSNGPAFDGDEHGRPGHGEGGEADGHSEGEHGV